LNYRNLAYELRRKIVAKQHDFPQFPTADHIPKIIHQTYNTRILPVEISDIINNLRLNNPKWEYRFYDDKDRIKCIANNYGDKMLDYYYRINPIYGAAKADFFVICSYTNMVVFILI
jgi:mannosyltransferase OCH1-like enzyme